MSYSLTPAAPAEWPQCEPFLLAALKHTKDWGIEHVALSALRGSVALWKVTDGERIVGAGATTISAYPNRSIFDVLLFGGEGFPDLVDDLKAIAKSCGCAALSGRGRKGWLRAIPGAEPVNLWELEV